MVCFFMIIGYSSMHYFWHYLMFAYYHDGTHDSFQSLLFGISIPLLFLPLNWRIPPEWRISPNLIWYQGEDGNTSNTNTKHLKQLEEPESICTLVTFSGSVERNFTKDPRWQVADEQHKQAKMQTRTAHLSGAKFIVSVQSIWWCASSFCLQTIIGFFGLAHCQIEASHLP